MTSVDLDGLCLNVEIWDDGEPLLLLHGFTGSTETWRSFRSAWPGRQLIAVDLVGHGRSDSPPDLAHYRMDACIEDLVAVLGRLGIKRVSLLGYSMGGRVALRLALAAPERFDRVILEGASPGIESPAERVTRQHADEELADRLEHHGIEWFVDYWGSLPLWATQQALAPEVRDRLRSERRLNNPTGLANSLRGMGAGADEPVTDRLSEIQVPVLLLAGALDTKYATLAWTMATHLPRATVAIVPDAGHACHLEQPERFASAVGQFLTAETVTGPTSGPTKR
ncbi:MAG: 2-succinyl-6-hydroxy-2,4-cyclohexadiene-1-carboxylate synthase [Dehalococcoidia bacterium]